MVGIAAVGGTTMETMTKKYADISTTDKGFIFTVFELKLGAREIHRLKTNNG